MQIVAADKIFTGDEWLYDQAVVIDDGVIIDVISANQAQTGVTEYNSAFIAPAFIDVQVYGAADKLFASYLYPETLEMMHQEFEREGACLFQITLATNTWDVFRKGIDAVRAYRDKGGEGVHGLHLEGPWLNPVRRGAHVKELIHPPSPDEVKKVLDYGRGIITMITMAPEVCDAEITDLVRSYGVIISAGHTDATYEQAMESFDHGITAVTHLYNAMSPLHHRAPGMVGATLHHEKVYASIIPDGYHVNYAAIAVAKKIMGPRLFAITDAVAETTDGPYQHHRVGEKFECNGTLSGSALSMYAAFHNLVEKAGVPVEEALRMCSLYPARVLGIEKSYGNISAGAVGKLLVLNNRLELVDYIS